eukprot:COSAG05_NODE_619_length_8315_cov_5.484421_5_plen_111_part_00
MTDVWQMYGKVDYFFSVCVFHFFTMQPIFCLILHRDTTKVLDDAVDWYYSVHYKGFSDAIVEEINEEDALWRCSKLVRYQKEWKACAAVADVASKLQDMRGSHSYSHSSY